MIKFKERRLINKYMIRHVFKSGKKNSQPGLSVFVANPISTYGDLRMGFIVRKKTGNAVLRNKLKRIFRSEFQKLLPSIKKPIWILVDVPPRPLENTLKTLRESVNTVLALYTR